MPIRSRFRLLRATSYCDPWRRRGREKKADIVQWKNDGIVNRKMEVRLLLSALFCLIVYVGGAAWMVDMNDTSIVAGAESRVSEATI